METTKNWLDDKDLVLKMQIQHTNVYLKVLNIKFGILYISMQKEISWSVDGVYRYVRPYKCFGKKQNDTNDGRLG